MEENKKDYSDFFKSQNDKMNDSRENREEDQPERPSYYYSYGPYKSSMQDGSEPEVSSSYPSQEDNNSVEVSAPRPVRPYPFAQEPGAPTSTNWTPAPAQPKRRSAARSMFAAFMAGAVLVGSLMFASDKMNLFTGSNSGGSGSGSASAPANASSSGSGASAGVKSAALDISRPGSVSSIVDQASPAVVKIESMVTTKQRTRSNSLYDDPFFQYFFGDNGSQQNQQPKAGTKQAVGMGTGFIFEKSGYILTNQHVIEGAEEIQVTVQGTEKPYVAKLLGNSADLDLAVLKIEGNNDFPILPIGDSNSMKIGDWVVAIGNPYGFEHTVTVGVLSAKEREIDIPENNTTRTYKHLFQTDASINPGNSGGPLLNLNGEVVGINTAVNAQAQGIGFAIPTSTISDVLESLKNNVQIPKTPVPYIGATLSSLEDVEASYLKELKVEGTKGVMVVNVELGHPAFKAGLKTYDVITSIDGTTVNNKEELITKIQAKKVGDKATFGIIRDGQKTNLDITIGNKNDYTNQQQQQK
jgi:serine protease Do